MSFRNSTEIVGEIIVIYPCSYSVGIYGNIREKRSEVEPHLLGTNDKIIDFIFLDY